MLRNLQLATYDIEIKYQGYVGENKYILLLGPIPSSIFLENTTGPTWDDTKTIAVQIHQE